MYEFTSIKRQFSMVVSSDAGKSTSSRMVRWIVIAAIALSSIVVVANVWPIGPDYFFTFHRTAEKWLNGETRLYDDNPTIEVPGNPDIGFFNAPWTLIVLVPLALLPLQLGQAILTVGSVAGIILCWRALSQTKPIPIYALILVLANLHTFDMLLRGGIDVIPLMGVVLGWWAVQSRRPILLSLAFAMITVKPLNAVLPSLVLLMSIRQWTWAEKLRTFCVPIILIVASAFVFGLDWPLRYLRYSQFVPPNDYLSTAIWRGLAQIGLPAWPVAVLAVCAAAMILVLAWRAALSQWVLAVALATNLAFATYVHGNHYVLLIPALIWVARKDWRLAVLAYLVTWTPLLRSAYGFSVAPIDVIYPLLLLISLWGLKLVELRKRNRLVSWSGLTALLAKEHDDEVTRIRLTTVAQP
jgi:hypothetical protein